MNHILITEGTVNYEGAKRVDGSLVKISCSFEGICSPEDFVELTKAMVKGLRFEVKE